MCRTFQITLNPQHMTVMENMLLGAQHQIGENIVAAALRPAAVRRQEAENLERAWDLLGMVNLRHHSDELAGSLSGGQKKLLALAQVLMAEPRLIRSEEHTSELQSLMRISYAVFCLKKKIEKF